MSVSPLYLDPNDALADLASLQCSESNSQGAWAR